MRPEDRAGSFGIPKELPPRVEAVNLLDRLTLMIIMCDNPATNLCRERMGMHTVNQASASPGLKATGLHGKVMDMAARERRLDNVNSTGDIGDLLELVASEQILTPDRRRLAQEILARQQLNQRLPLQLPPEAKVAHRTGELPGIRHEVGVVSLDAGGS